ncbi:MULTISPECIES: S8 family serine peptidase [Streptomyces]|uniref:S8 family serine peptidase n=1 Tax=Streptomyces nigra TaxID=1827580 RepID=UPI00368E98BF
MHARSVLDDLPLRRGELLGDARVCIAVLDGPVDVSHPCLDGANLRRVDTLVHDPAGKGPMSVHGTHVTSLIFGQPERGSLAGIAPHCRGLLLPVFKDGANGRVAQMDLARAIERAVHEGAHIINISGGERTPDGQADALLERALRLCEDSGVLVVAAVGNDGCDCLQVPAAMPSVLAVGAAGIAGEPLESNNWGGMYGNNGVLAPGQNIEGAVPGGGSIAMTGSSFAAPQAAGVAALLVAAQLDQGGPADPHTAGRAILQTASAAACSPDDSPECRRYLAGSLDAAAAYRLITGRSSPRASDRAVITATPAPPSQGQAAMSGVGVDAAGGRSMPATAPFDSTAIQDPTEGDTSAAEDTLAGGVGEGHRPAPLATPAEPQVRAESGQGVDAADGPSPLVTSPSDSTEGETPMDSEVTPATVAGTASGPSDSTPATPAPRPTAPSTAHDPSSGGVRPSCECTENSSTCTCQGKGGRRPLIYAIGTIGYDFQTEARKDSFRQLMPPVEGTTPAGELTAAPANPFDPNQLHAYLSERPSEARHITWTLQLDNVAVYALEPEPSAAMDWSRPITAPSSEELKKEDAEADHRRLMQLMETLSHPPVSPVLRSFRDAIQGQVLPPDDPNFVSRVSIPGELTDRTVQLFNGMCLPVVQVHSRGLYTWNEAALVDEVTRQVRAQATERSLAISEDNLRKTLRGFLDRIYIEFRNLGQSAADRALNAAATNAFLFGSVLVDGLMSAKLVPGSEDRLYALDSITVSKSPYCRPGSECEEVRVTFFDPENERRSRVTYQFTIDVSEPFGVSLAPAHTFFEK